MDNPTYLALSRQSGLLKEMQVVANNIANASTTGYRREGVIFAEMIEPLPEGAASLSMTEARVRRTDFSQGAMVRTGGPLDVAIEGDGFFMVQTPQGPTLTRNGAFARDAAGALVTLDGYPVLDEGGAALFVPAVGEAVIATDGTVTVDGEVQGRLAVVTVPEPDRLIREGGVMFRADQPLEPADGVVFQGFVEGGNVQPVVELARMIEVQRAYELGQAMLEREDERIRAAVRQLGGQS
ncbi:MAG: flagellar hook-basal body complex protein [Albimonas sp.]|uniref:flagellar hook-basal body complex protein n=1 Tax=Albimonas sp. TaxID=1872425 RepID=UPI0040578711